MWTCTSTCVLEFKMRARQKCLDLINPGETFVYQGLSLFENSTSVKDLKVFAPHILDRCFWFYSTGDWILKKHSVGKTKDLFLLSLPLLPTRPPHLLLELLQILQMGLLAFHHIYTHLSLPHSKWVLLKPRSQTLIKLPKLLRKDLQILNSLFLPDFFFLLLFSPRWSFPIFLNVNIFEHINIEIYKCCFMKSYKICMPTKLATVSRNRIEPAWPKPFKVLPRSNHYLNF